METKDGRAIAGARIVLRHLETGLVVRAQAAGDGIFRMGELPPGSYELTVQAAGFEVFTQKPVVLEAGAMVVSEVSLARRPDAEEARARPLPSRPGESEAKPEERGSYREIARRPDASGLEAQFPELLPPDSKVRVARPDRWNLPMPSWDRYEREGEYPYVKGRWFDPFNRNRVKGDYPLIGQDIFFNFTGISLTAMDGRRLYIPSGVSTGEPGGRSDFFGRGGQMFVAQTFRFAFDLFKGETAFRPFDWRVRVTPAVSLNQLWTRERGIVNFDVRKGTARTDHHVGLQEAFFEARLRHLSPNFDFVSVRAGIQQFNSDFRGLIFTDEQPGLRLFGTLRRNRLEYNLAYFYFLEKDTNSLLNSFHARDQQVMVANLYIQDSLVKGYTTQFSYHFNKDDGDLYFDHNDFLVRPAPIGTVQRHNVRAHYIGWTGNGHFGRLNVSHAFYQVLGHDSLNPLAGRRVDINAQLGALEFSIDKDWVRPRIAFLFASGDSDPRDGTGRGFDAIVEAQVFAGGIFSFFNREFLPLTGAATALIAPESFLPNLKTNKFEGQSNFVNPGLAMLSTGVDLELTPEIKAVANLNLMRFHRTEPLQFLLFQSGIRSSLGADYGTGLIYRPRFTENIVVTGGVSALTPGSGLRQIYTGRTLFSSFGLVRFQF